MNQAIIDDLNERHLYLEEVEGEAALGWVKTQNARTLDQLGQDPRYEGFQTEVLKIVEATDRMVVASFSKPGKVDDYWQDAQHVRGILRRADLQAFLDGEPNWGALLDLDAIAAAEDKNWVFKGGQSLPPERARLLVNLSDGGKDAVVVREYDLDRKAFVAGGFDLPEGKQSATWVDEDTLYVSREWVPGEMTTSGYAFVTKRLERGQSLDQAVEVFRGEPTDIMAERGVLRDVDGAYVMDVQTRRLSFFEVQTAFITDAGPVIFPLPATTELETYCQGQLVFQLKSDWSSARGTAYSSGTLISVDLATSLQDPDAIEPAIVFAPGPHETVQGVAQTRSRLILQILSNVTGQVVGLAYENGAWIRSQIALPQNASLSLASTADDTDSLFVLSSGFTEPNSLYLADAVTGAAGKVKSSPARFDPDGLRVEQRWATSNDGARIPYFLVCRADIALDGQTPTLLYAYGGFQHAMMPGYSGVIGKLWLERGGAYVLANIRGGGEFGPSWHQAGLKTKRQLVFDDFRAVAEDLIAKGVTSPRRLGIMGGSNGGLLMGVQITQRPDLWNAAVVEVPLLDMLRYHHLLAGASWMGEFGDPEHPEEGEFLRSISPYHNLKPGVQYPEPLFITSTKDDRVHPGHARKMAALMQDLGLPFLYYENIDGGHAASANLRETARRNALEFIYLTRKLMDEPG